MTSLTIRDFTKADMPWLIEAHSTLYARDEGFDESFRDLVTDIITTFMTEPDRTGRAGWLAVQDEMPIGCIFCDRGAVPGVGRLRMFLVTPAARGQGLGRKLLGLCMEFARKSGYRQLMLWTHESHRAACALYAASGFRCVSNTPTHSFGVDVVEQIWEIDL